MDAPMTIAILKSVRDEIRGLRDDSREWKEELRRYWLEKKEKEQSERSHRKRPTLREVEGSTPSVEDFADDKGQWTAREEGKRKPREEKREEREDGWMGLWAKEERNEKKRTAEQSSRRTDEGKEEEKTVEKNRGQGVFAMNWEREMWEREVKRRNLSIKGIVGEGENGRIEIERVLREAVGKKIEVQVISSRIRTCRGDALTIVRVESAEIRDEVLGKTLDICRMASWRVEEDLTWTERATRYRLREKAEEERKRGRDVRLGKREVWVDEEKWSWLEREQEWKREVRTGRESEHEKRQKREERATTGRMARAYN